MGFPTFTFVNQMGTTQTQTPKLLSVFAPASNAAGQASALEIPLPSGVFTLSVSFVLASRYGNLIGAGVGFRNSGSNLFTGAYVGFSAESPRPAELSQVGSTFPAVSLLGGNTVVNAAAVTLKLVRSGDTVTVYHLPDGAAQVFSQAVDISGADRYGLFVVSNGVSDVMLNVTNWSVA